MNPFSSKFPIQKSNPDNLIAELLRVGENQSQIIIERKISDFFQNNVSHLMKSTENYIKLIKPLLNEIKDNENNIYAIIIDLCKSNKQIKEIIKHFIENIGQQLSEQIGFYAQNEIELALKQSKQYPKNQQCKEMISHPLNIVGFIKECDQLTQGIRILLKELNTQLSKDRKINQSQSMYDYWYTPIFDNLFLQIIYQENIKNIRQTINSLAKQTAQQLEKCIRQIILPNQWKQYQNITETKQLIIGVLESLQFQSPILEIDLDDIKQGKYLLFMNGEFKEVDDISHKEVRNSVEERIGSQGLRILTENPLIISPSNNVKNFASNKNYEAYLDMLSYYLDQRIELQVDGKYKLFGVQNDKNCISLTLEDYQIIPNNRYSISLQNQLKQDPVDSAIQSILFITKLEEGNTEQDALNFITNDLNVEKFLKDAVQNTQVNQEIRSILFEKPQSNTDQIYGGCDSGFINDKSSNNFFERKINNKAFYNLVEKAKEIKQKVDEQEDEQEDKTKLREEAELCWSEINDKNKIRVRINGKKSYGGFHEILPTDMTKQLFMRSCGLEYGFNPSFYFNGTHYNWLQLQNALRIQTAFVLFKKTNENNLITGAGHHSCLKLHKGNKTEKNFHDDLRQILNDEKKIEDALPRLIEYQLNNTLNLSDLPGSSVQIGLNNEYHNNEQIIDDFNLSVACARNDLKRIALQSELFYVGKNNHLYNKKGNDRKLSPIDKGTPRTSKNKDKIRESSTYINEFTYKLLPSFRQQSEYLGGDYVEEESSPKLI